MSADHVPERHVESIPLAAAFWIIGAKFQNVSAVTGNGGSCFNFIFPGLTEEQVEEFNRQFVNDELMVPANSYNEKVRQLHSLVKSRK